jgi:hypothetical protein
MLFLAFCSGSGKFKEQTVRSNAVLAVERTAANPRTFALACELITRLRASTGHSDKDAVQFCGRTHLSCGRTHLHKTATFLLRASSSRACMRARNPYKDAVLFCGRTHLCCGRTHLRKNCHIFFTYLIFFIYLLFLPVFYLLFLVFASLFLID